MGWLALALAVPTLVTGMLTLDMQEGVALPNALPGFGCAYITALALLLLGAGWMQLHGWRTRAVSSRVDNSTHDAPPAAAANTSSDPSEQKRY